MGTLLSSGCDVLREQAPATRPGACQRGIVGSADGGDWGHYTRGRPHVQQGRRGPSDISKDMPSQAETFKASVEALSGSLMSPIVSPPF